MAGTVEEADRAILRKEFAEINYEFSIDIIKVKLEQSFYKLEACTFISVSQQIFRYASKGKKEYQNSINNPEVSPIRTTLNMKDLEQQLVMNFFDMTTKDGPVEQKDEG